MSSPDITSHQDLQSGDRFLLSGELHYFRVPRPRWRQRLAHLRDLGLNAVSTYVPWNWHQPAPGAPPDFSGKAVAERDLRAFLDLVADSGLACVFRPGPFITGEWRNGGLPDWLWESEPGMLALNAAGQPAGAPSGYQAVTYAHPAYEAAVRRWMAQVLRVAVRYLSSAGGPIVNVQLDDESSYWQQMWHPLGLDYNPVLVEASDGPSRYSAWLLDRYGTLAALNESHGTKYARPADIEPPRTIEGPLVMLMDWQDFKLHQINEHIALLHDLALGAGIDVPLSVLFPYLLPLNASKFSRFAAERGLRLHLTNEVYLSLFEGASCPEHKLGHIVASHETYLMWQEGGVGVPTTMELQSSNASYLTAEAMELLYATTVARGIKGINFFMTVGGSTPPGFENVLGSAYDVSCPISAAGDERPHAEAIRKLSGVIEASGAALAVAEPLRDVWCGYYVPYETGALVGHLDDANAGLVELVREVFSGGEMGTSVTPSLQVLMALSSVSAGAVDLERAGAGRLAACRQLWVMSSHFMSEPVQQKLLSYAREGGDLVMLPGLPSTADGQAPCTLLAEAVFGAGAIPQFPGMEAVGSALSTMVDAPDGVRLAARGDVAVLPATGHRDQEAGGGPAGRPGSAATVLARKHETGEPCAVRYPVGSGSLTVIGFRLQYAPTEESDHQQFLTSLVEAAGARRHAATANPHMAAMQLSGPEGGLLCLVNPTEWSQTSTIRFTGPGGDRVSMPVHLRGVKLERKGARLLPVDQALLGGRRLHHATAELVARRFAAGAVELVFAAAAAEPIEVAISDGPVACEVSRGVLLQRTRAAGLTLVVVQPTGSDVALRISIPQEPG